MDEQVFWQTLHGLAREHSFESLGTTQYNVIRMRHAKSQRQSGVLLLMLQAEE
jgi:hypothetical protein